MHRTDEQQFPQVKNQGQVFFWVRSDASEMSATEDPFGAEGIYYSAFRPCQSQTIPSLKLDE